VSSDQIIRCTGCEHSFDGMDDRAFIGVKGSESSALCPLCAILLRSSEEWAIWNDCNGVFESFPRRALAHDAIKQRYGNADVKVVPVRTFLEPVDNHWHRQAREDELEKRRATSEAKQWKGPVTQAWAHAIPFMQQTVLLTAVRGPDGIAKYHSVKYLLRWFRRCTLVSSLDGRVLFTPFETCGGSFMGPSYDVEHSPIGDVCDLIDWPRRMNHFVSDYLRATDELPHHFQLHFMHAVQIVGYKHDVPEIRAWWQGVYLRLVHDMHLWPETEAQMDARLGDDRSAWLARNDEATVA
jgi:hypothetical protein